MVNMFQASVDATAHPVQGVRDFRCQPDDGPRPVNNHAPFPGPLISKTMQKKDLMLFIHSKTQHHLQRSEEPVQKEEYFFWQIMDLFYRHSGKVLMVQVATVLFRGYALFRSDASTLRGDDNTEDWCLPLARLLCSYTPRDKNMEAVIGMGDDLASRGLIYAAHICYVVAKVELGTRSHFDLIGCDSFPFGQMILNEAIERTEVYEYMLSLTSGLPQPNFQRFKFCHASRTAQAELPDEAYGYCESIARAVISFPGSFKRSFIERLISLAYTVQADETEDPEWLRELFKLHRVKVSEDESRPNETSTSPEVESSIQDSRSDPSENFPQSDPEGEFSLRYTVGELLGKGGFGSVYSGTRKEDGKEVAIKYVKKSRYDKHIRVPGEKCMLPVEVALMKMVSEPPRCNNVIELIEWFDMTDRIILVLERPVPCMNISEFAELHDGLSEDQIRAIMLQVIRAARHCRDRHVLHRDIKAANLVINTETLQVKLIDFGCGDIMKDTQYTRYAGTDVFCPPELTTCSMYEGIPATVWGLGVLFYNLFYGEFPFLTEDDFFYGHLKLDPGVSRDFLDLMMWCLEMDPNMRPTLEDITQHEWFTGNKTFLVK